MSMPAPAMNPDIALALTLIREHPNDCVCAACRAALAEAMRHPEGCGCEMCRFLDGEDEAQPELR